jgi:lipid-binding SYLF domain-containing protein
MRFSNIRALGCALVLFAVGSLSTLANAGPREIDASVHAALDRFYYQVPSSRSLASRAAGILVFPEVVKAGFGFGAEYGEGALLIGGRTAGYYNDVSGSFGFQIGAQARSVVIMFMTPEALNAFYRKDGWKVGVDGSVTLITVGTGGAADSNSVTSPVVGYIYGQKGLMYNLTLEGSKITRIYR